MIAPMQNYLMKEIMKNYSIKTILDPFHGSGTTLYEAVSIDPSLELYGIDINPLANLITNVKLNGVSKNIDKNIALINKILISTPKLNYTKYFNNINKWFRYDIIESFTLLNYSISKIKNKKDRLYFWYCLINLVRKYCNSRPSKYKLHIKEATNIVKINNTVIQDFLNDLEDKKAYFLNTYKNNKLYSGNVLKELDNFSKNLIDLIITSPPYGDNATTVTYGQYSILPLLWIDRKDLTIKNNELSTYSKIDRISLGGTKVSTINNLKYYIDTLDKISKHKQQKVINFMEDYILTLQKLSTITKKYIILTLGNRRVHNVVIDLT